MSAQNQHSSFDLAAAREWAGGPRHPRSPVGPTCELLLAACDEIERLKEQYESAVWKAGVRERHLKEQLEALRVALSFYAEKGGDGGAVARSVLKNERPPEHIFAFFRELHGVPNPATKQEG